MAWAFLPINGVGGLGYEWVPRIFPGINSSTEDLYVVVTSLCVFRRLTGSGPFCSSGTVEDDLLVLRQGGKFWLQFRQENRAFQINPLALLVILVCAD